MKCLVMGQYQFHGPARFVRALKVVGFEVATLCQKGDLLGKTDFADRRFFANVLDEREMVETLHQAVVSFHPDFVLPSSEINVQVLQTYRKLIKVGRVKLDEAHRRMIENCSFSPDAEPLVFNKIDLLDKLAERGVRVPLQRELHTFGDADAFIQANGYPVILKPSFGSGGVGIHICHDEDQLFAVLPECIRSGSRYCIQQYLGNQTANIQFAAKSGELLAWNMAYRVKTHPGETGPTSVIRVIDNPEMLAAAREVCRLVSYSGVGSTQCVVEKEGHGRAWAIEMNPRLGAFPHIWQKIGTDLALALKHGWSGGPPVPQKPPQVGLTVALYPQEVIRDPESPYLEGIVDRPDGDAKLLAAYDQLIELKGTKPVAANPSPS